MQIRKYTLAAIILNIIVMAALLILFGCNFFIHLSLGESFIFSKDLTLVSSALIFGITSVLTIVSIIFSILALKLVKYDDEQFYKNKKFIDLLSLFNGLLIGFYLGYSLSFFNIYLIIGAIIVLGITLIFFVDYYKVKNSIEIKQKNASYFDSDDSKKL